MTKKIGHSGIAQRTGASFSFEPIDILQWLQKFSCADWLIVIVNKRTDT